MTTSIANGAAVEPQVEQQPVPGSEQQTQPTPAPAPEATPTPTPAPAAEQPDLGYLPLRDALKASGYEVAEGLDDHEALRQVVTAARQAQQFQQLAQYGQAVLPHWSQFQEWQRQQQAAQQQKPGQDKPWWAPYWSPPEYDPSWERQLERDPQTGELKVKAGGPPDVLAKYQSWKHYRDQQAEKFLQNPFQFFEEPVKVLAQQVAQQVAQQHLAGYADRAYAAEFVRQNSGWLHQQDPGGKPTGALSAEGQIFAGHVKHAVEQLGIRDIRQQQEYALGMLQRDLAIAQIRQQQAGQTGEQAKQQFLKQAAGGNHVPGHGGSIPGGAAPPAAPLQNKGLSLAELMRANLKQAGVTDDTLQTVA